jgi:hypothetical protein
MQAAMWRTSGDAVGGNCEASALTRTLPVVDPEMDNLPNQPIYFNAAVASRNALAQNYLTQWNNQMMGAFDALQIGQMSQFGVLWRGFTCGQLQKLIAQYPSTNLPFQIRMDLGQLVGSPSAILESDYRFIGVCYWPPLTPMASTVFPNPKRQGNQGAVPADQTFAAVSMYMPRNRLVWTYVNGGGGGTPPTPIGGVPGDPINLPGTGNNNGGNNNNGVGLWEVVRQGNPTDWTLLNQNWTLKLVPAVSTVNTNMVAILQTPPPAIAAGAQALPLPSLGNLSIQDWNQLNSH